ncbi:MAG TPA: matrixin family metalloprotease [Polyangiaceae bacterium]|nr:matrixin family metalloprotease [Polyangiaceae bacterium]
MSKALRYSFVLAGAYLFCTPSALAFCRTNTCDPSKGDTCTLDSAGCRTGGHDLAWVSSCVTYAVQEDGSKANQVSASVFENILADAFATWKAADCGDGKHPSINVESLGLVSCNKPEYNSDQGNANVFMFDDEDWMTTGSGDALGLTTVWFDRKTGQIYDADVEVNGTGRLTHGSPQDGADLQSIVTHEIGHFLGLDHANTQSAVMYATYNPGRDNLRLLRDDDVKGICAIYPPSRQAASSECEPRHGFASTCAVPKEDEGCSFSVPRKSSNTPLSRGAFPVLFALAGLVGWARGRRRRVTR